MPFVQIILQDGKSQEAHSHISDAVHEGLVKHFDIPETDRFHIVQVVAGHHCCYPANYLDIPHSDDIVFISITAKGGRTAEMKKQLYGAIATTIEKRTDISSNDVVIVLTENSEEDWSFGRGKAQLIGNR